MAVTNRTLLEVDHLRAVISAHVDETTRQLVVAWADAWDELATLWQNAILDLAYAAKDGKWPARRTVLRAERAAAALESSRALLEELGKTAGVTISGDLPAVVNDTVTGQTRIYGSQLPPGQVIELARLNQRSMDAIVRRTTQQITSLVRPLSTHSYMAMKGSLIRGMAVGDNPRTVAAEMVARVNGAFTGGLNRALVIARTEMLDASRAAAHGTDMANRDVLSGWQWVSALDDRTCPGCWSMHGRKFPLDVPGPEDHQQGRCARMPATLSWKELGFDIPEPPSLLPDAEQTFKALPRDTQLQIMGPARLNLLDTGQAQWGDLAAKRSTPGWRDSWAPAPVSDLAS